MAGVAYQGEAFPLTFTAPAGSVVTVSWLDPYGNAEIQDMSVAEDPLGSGQYPQMFTLTVPGMWTARFASSSTTDIAEYFIRVLDVSGPPPLASVGDVTGQMTLSAAQQTLAAWLLRVASSLVRQQFPSTDRLVAAGKLDPDVVALAVTNMVLRVLRNPGGLRSETTGPFSRTYDTTYAAGLLILGGDEETMLAPSGGGTVAKGRIGTARIGANMVPRDGGRYGVHR
jgi:hypothetical protein